MWPVRENVVISNELKATALRVGRAALGFVFLLAVAGFLVGSGEALDLLVGIALEEESKTYEVYRFVSDIFFVGSAIVISAVGALVAAFDALRSVWEYMRRP